MDLVQELHDSTDVQVRGGREKGKVAFLRNLDNVQNALDAGYSQRAIWSHLKAQGEMPGSLRQFQRYVAQYLAADRIDKVEPVERGGESAPKPLSVNIEIAVPMSPSGSPQVVVRSTPSHEGGSTETEVEPVAASANEREQATGVEPELSEASVSSSGPVEAPQEQAADPVPIPSTTVQEPRHAKPPGHKEWNPVPDPKVLY